MSVAIDQALINALRSAALGVDIVLENGVYCTWNGASYDDVVGAYTVDPGTPYMEATVIPASVGAVTLAHTDEHLGVFQIVVNYPADSGSYDAKQTAEAVLALFAVGVPVAYSGQNVYPVAKGRTGGRMEGGFYQIVVRVNYRAFTNRS